MKKVIRKVFRFVVGVVFFVPLFFVVMVISFFEMCSDKEGFKFKSNVKKLLEMLFAENW